LHLPAPPPWPGAPTRGMRFTGREEKKIEELRKQKQQENK
jgi:hypothetical protein